MYRIGPSDVFSPSDLQADAKTLDGQVATLDAAIDGNQSIPQDQWDTFTIWESDWKKFRSSTFDGWFDSFLASWNDSNRDQLIAFENQFITWQKTFASSGVAFPGPVVQPSTGSGDTLGNHLGNQLKNAGLPSLGSITVLVVVLVVGFIVYKVVA
jgi:hypothetical protein